MRKRTNQNEEFVSLYEIALEFDLNHYTLLHWARKMGTRNRIMNGARVIEIEDAIYVLRFLDSYYQDRDFSEPLNQLEQRVSDKIIIK